MTRSVYGVGTPAYMVATSRAASATASRASGGSSTTSATDLTTVSLPDLLPSGRWALTSSLPETTSPVLSGLGESTAEDQRRLAREKAVEFAKERVEANDPFGNPYSTWNETLWPTLAPKNRIKGMTEALASLQPDLYPLRSGKWIQPDTFVVFSAHTTKDTSGRFVLCER